MTKEATIKLTAAIGIAGQLVARDSIITIPEAAAKDLLRRGKAVLATEADEPGQDEADEQDGEPEEEALPVVEPEDAAPAAKPAGKKK